jgi:hypothetical protein
MEYQPISKGQLRRIQTLWGILYRHTVDGAPGDSRAARLAWIGLKVGRRIGSCNDLSKTEAKKAIEAIQKCLPAEAVRSSDRSQAMAQGRDGRKGAESKEVRLPDAGTMQLLQNLLFALGWDRARLDLFLHSPKSPVRAIRTLADANKIIWVLKGMLRRRERHQELRGVQNEGRENATIDHV